jgi:hypothetical protein
MEYVDLCCMIQGDVEPLKSVIKVGMPASRYRAGGMIMDQAVAYHKTGISVASRLSQVKFQVTSANGFQQQPSS